MLCFSKSGAAALVLAASLSSGVFPVAAQAQRPTAAQSGLALDKGFDGLWRQDGTPFDHRQLAGKPTLVFFGFVSCGSVCPTALQSMTVTAEDIAAKYGKENVPNLLFVTTLPEHEGAQQIQAFLKNFHPSLIGLSAQKAGEAFLGDSAALQKVQQIEKLLERFRIVRDGHHSPFAYLVGPDLKFIGKPLNTQDGPDRMAAEIIRLLGLDKKAGLNPAP